MLDRVFSPMKIGTVEIPNRLVVPAMVVNYNTDDGMVTERFIQYMVEKAKGGYGLLLQYHWTKKPGSQSGFHPSHA